MSALPETPLVFECAGERLVGILHPGAADARVGVVIVIGGPQYRVGSHRQFVAMARRFAAAGYPVLRFDYRGMGDSDGAPRTFEDIDTDIRCAVDAMIGAVRGVGAVVLLGLCDAASANLMYCASDARVGGLILLNPWARTERGEAQSYLRHYYLQRLLQRSFWRKLLEGKFELGRSLADLFRKLLAARGRTGGEEGSAGATRPDFLTRMIHGFGAFDRPVLFLISGRDLTAQEFMMLASASKLWRKAMRRSYVAVRKLPVADHTFSARQDLDEACNEALAWLGGMAAHA